ncbi:glycogen debranching N-terminal domain-containing protein [Amycolatopsis carbonis]|uniref:Glycogen debranching N-terminal domain-containing protein n=1 Tax=Amycolatopsis carbonis TaxID=715471 RepID=A0A9Y2IAA8_9PSEU|nr:glycogen debranching N-terminal domain-containing protein [Amycolatopsis sp. 2-15]WIX75586.1 glycogen debranching N-terminal domain-containing protein [Amycolatopsis sp. 2-15]
MSAHTLVRGTTFLITGDAANATAGTEGFYLDDTRHLSHWEFSAGGAALRVLNESRDRHSTSTILTPATARHDDPGYTVFRDQALGAGTLVEHIRVRSHLAVPGTVTVSFRFAADFADQFELRGTGHYERPGKHSSITRAHGEVLLAYERADYRKWTVLRASAEPVVADGQIGWTLELPPHGEVSLRVEVLAGEGEPVPDPGAHPAVFADVVREAQADTEEFLAGVTVPAWPELRSAVEAGLADLANLRLPAPGRPDLRIPGAGVPWFLTLFGRDSLITSISALPYSPDLAAHTLRALAAVQGQVLDPARIEEPGKIVHEVRRGELSRFGQVPYGQYYGTVDATPLFLVLLGRHRRVAGNGVAIELEAAARAAVDWMFGHGGLAEHGYLVYHTDGPGLVHQCWKDSARSICFANGELATGPIAVSEAQGYAYEALVSTAELARDVWHDPAFADRLLARAARLRSDFETEFWLPGEDFVALALDGRRRRVDALASNAGHVLWSGILPAGRAQQVGHRLTEPAFFSGWGVRTLAAGQIPYHPVSYHNGGVWPHDTAIAVAGLARAGLTAEATYLAEGLLAAAARQPGNRLPEVMTGYARSEIPRPVRYPHSASPQAWAAAAPLLIATALGSSEEDSAWS